MSELKGPRAGRESAFITDQPVVPKADNPFILEDLDALRLCEDSPALHDRLESVQEGFGCIGMAFGQAFCDSVKGSAFAVFDTTPQPKDASACVCNPNR